MILKYKSKNIIVLELNGITRKISSSSINKTSKTDAQQIIIKPPKPIEETDVSVASLPGKLEIAKEMDFFYALREKAEETLSKTKKQDKLGMEDSSSDHIIITGINENDDFSSIIKDFNKLDNVIGLKITKKLIIQILNTIKDPSFRESEEGRLIYTAYREFVRNTNINILEQAEKLIYKEDTLQNVVFYLVLGCDVQVTDFVSLSRNINDILSCTNVSLDASVITSSKSITDIGTELTTNLNSDQKKALDDLTEIEESKKSYLKKFSNVAYGAFKWAMSGGIISTATKVTVVTATLGFSTKFIAPIIFSYFSQLTFSDPKKPSIETKDVEKQEAIVPSVPDSGDDDPTLASAIGQFFITLGQILTKKK